MNEQLRVDVEQRTVTGEGTKLVLAALVDRESPESLPCDVACGRVGDELCHAVRLLVEREGRHDGVPEQRDIAQVRKLIKVLVGSEDSEEESRVRGGRRPPRVNASDALLLIVCVASPVGQDDTSLSIPVNPVDHHSMQPLLQLNVPAGLLVRLLVLDEELEVDEHARQEVGGRAEGVLARLLNLHVAAEAINEVGARRVLHELAELRNV
mmetsp:Transcript_49336/g.154753  ORF Transcript_49336/g.154753 Transcript_49336/m.154753 type:complete len:210 (-) Transcript_49336:193-822(-)